MDRQQVTSLVSSIAGQYDIDPRLIMSLIERENPGFDPSIVNPADQDTGLGQITPIGMEQINQLLGTDATFSSEDMQDPEKNIQGIAVLLKSLLGQYEGNNELALAGYNAGPGAVAKAGGNVPEFAQGYVDEVMGRYSDPGYMPEGSFGQPPAPQDPGVMAAAPPPGADPAGMMAQAAAPPQPMGGSPAQPDPAQGFLATMDQLAGGMNQAAQPFVGAMDQLASGVNEMAQQPISPAVDPSGGAMGDLYRYGQENKLTDEDRQQNRDQFGGMLSSIGGAMSDYNQKGLSMEAQEFGTAPPMVPQISATRGDLPPSPMSAAVPQGFTPEFMQPPPEQQQPSYIEGLLAEGPGEGEAPPGGLGVMSSGGVPEYPADMMAEIPPEIMELFDRRASDAAANTRDALRQSWMKASAAFAGGLGRPGLQGFAAAGDSFDSYYDAKRSERDVDLGTALSKYRMQEGVQDRADRATDRASDKISRGFEQGREIRSDALDEKRVEAYLQNLEPSAVDQIVQKAVLDSIADKPGAAEGLRKIREVLHGDAAPQDQSSIDESEFRALAAYLSEHPEDADAILAKVSNPMVLSMLRKMLSEGYKYDEDRQDYRAMQVTP